MIIHIKGIWEERVEDAPFCGALISSIDCNFNCKNCFNQHIKDLPTLEYSEQEIINKVKQNPFHEGIILSGLEWTQQPEEMRTLIDCALKNNLQVILYTGMDESNFKQQFFDIYNLPIYIKFGHFDESLKTETYEMYGVKLHSKNQYITKGWFYIKTIDFNDTNIYFAKIKPDAIIPSKREEDGAYDLYACIDEDVRIPPHCIMKIPTGIKSAFSPKYRIVFQERGSTGQIGLKVNAGLIDSGFRGEWFVILNNTTNKDIVIYKTDQKEDIHKVYDYVYYPSSKAICQFKMQEVPQVKIVEVTEEEIMQYASERGEGKLGSSLK